MHQSYTLEQWSSRGATSASQPLHLWQVWTQGELNLQILKLRKSDTDTVVLYRPQQIGDFLLPIAEGAAADYTAVFKGVLHITQVALRNLRNTTGYPASKANSGLWVT